jgi:hypothetical protein
MRPAACESFRQTSGFDGSAWIAGLVLAAGGGGTATRRGRGRAFAGAGLVRATCCGAGGLRGNGAAALCTGAVCDARQPGSRSLNRFGILGCASSSLLSSIEPSEVRVHAAAARIAQHARTEIASRDAGSNRFAGIDEATDSTDCTEFRKQPRHRMIGICRKTGTPKGNRTPVPAVRGRCPDR